jgi:hypothetical protein
MFKTDNDGVHVSHCCLKHGCKYGFMTKDPCPVATGKLKQEFRCEYCDGEWEMLGRPECGAAGCSKPGYWKWTGKASGCNLAMVVVSVTFYLCDGHDQWHREEQQHYFHAKALEMRKL